ncbi:MAG: DAK2 domain-containing protein [Dehalococcoidia bacterium]|nr:DAK2 domain-containing protein [Dehalococcoidia bacterium]
MVASTSDNGQTEPPGGPHPLSGDDLLDAIAAAAEHLHQSAAAVDAINVYPVPDGDTGTNMSATLRGAVDTAAILPSPRTAGAVLEALARGALYAARGNSGVILSQALAGLAQGTHTATECADAASLATGLDEAARTAYKAVSRPVEGTMLTVLREAATGAAAAVDCLPEGGRGASCLPTLLAATKAAEAAEARTIDQLPQLREAGMIDAGGEGICIILRGLLASLRGETPVVPAMPREPIAQLAGHAHEEFGYCTEFILEPLGDDLDVEQVRAWADARGHRSVVVVGGPGALRIHLHTDDADAVLAAARRFGALSRVKVDDMSEQHLRFRATGTGASAPLALLALSRGAGLDAMFESLGAAVADLGSIVKPPAGDIAAAADRLGVADVIVLPNHKDVILAAEQAATLARCTLHVLPAKTLPQGLAAAVAFASDAPVAKNLERMREAARTVTTVEVTHTTADRSIEGIAVRAGQFIALVDGVLRAARDSAVEALVAGLAAGGAAEGSLITLYYGDSAAAESRAAVPRVLTEAFPGAEVEAHDGGQSLYTFIASIEQ